MAFNSRLTDTVFFLIKRYGHAKEPERRVVLRVITIVKFHCDCRLLTLPVSNPVRVGSSHKQMFAYDIVMVWLTNPLIQAYACNLLLY